MYGMDSKIWLVILGMFFIWGGVDVYFHDSSYNSLWGYTVYYGANHKLSGMFEIQLGFLLLLVYIIKSRN